MVDYAAPRCAAPMKTTSDAVQRRVSFSSDSPAAVVVARVAMAVRIAQAEAVDQETVVTVSPERAGTEALVLASVILTLNIQLDSCP